MSCLNSSEKCINSIEVATTGDYGSTFGNVSCGIFRLKRIAGVTLGYDECRSAGGEVVAVSYSLVLSEPTDDTCNSGRSNAVSITNSTNVNTTDKVSYGTVGVAANAANVTVSALNSTCVEAVHVSKLVKSVSDNTCRLTAVGAVDGTEVSALVSNAGAESAEYACGLGVFANAYVFDRTVVSAVDTENSCCGRIVGSMS